jgi:Phosphotransferase enzyme family
VADPSPGAGTVALWTGPAFHEEVRQWVRDRAAAHDLELTGEWAQPHARTWSSALRFETTGGRIWFKVNGSGTRHEPGLVRLLSARVPGLVPDVLAVDTERGWSLTRDGGPMLRECYPPDLAWEPWEGLVVRYAEAQLAMAAESDAVLAAGVREVSPWTVPGLARSLLEELDGPAPEQGGLRGDEAARLAAALPRLEAWCAELGASGIPSSVQHDDLHSGNVCWRGSVATARIIDWGDASWGFPLATMLATMNSLAFHAGTYVEGRPVEDPAVLRVRDAYLEPFTGYATRDELVHLVDVARRAGCVAKALAYRSGLRDAPADASAELGFPVRDWLLGLVDP